MTDLRQACDRCHGKKLRCSKHPGAQTCTRCDRASALCVFSPPAKPVRSVPQATPCPDWLACLTEPSAITSNAELLEDLPLTDMLMLTTVLQSADQIYTNLPGEELYHVPVAQAAEHQARASQMLGLEDTFEKYMQALQQLELLYPIILARAATRDIDYRDVCKVDDCHHHTRETPPPESRSLRPNQFDYTLIQLLLACHQRLVDIAEAVLELGAQCFDRARELTPGNMQFDVPDIRAGSLLISKPTAAGMWMNMLRDSLVVLQKHLRPLPDILAAVRNPAEDEAQILNLQSKIITRRTQSGMEQLDRFRKGLLELDILPS
ncbi:hypothetical protein NLU13_7578 [Sarocladium strictum]|uniref:Zn(2)-C6 fungal-type domain-containing protein n=1 Tax=Sarocladium strictum TaxID=5046 RepID=A0AA39L5V7_SARSR|nr:hypothetical protein NLU13_7578 [Sarocladium strictum]